MSTPFTPHLSEELQQTLIQSSESISYVVWPAWSKAKLVENDVKIVIQIKGKIRAKLVVPGDSSHEEPEKLALTNDRIQTEIVGKDIIKIVAVPNKLANIAVKQTFDTSLLALSPTSNPLPEFLNSA